MQQDRSTTNKSVASSKGFFGGSGVETQSATAAGLKRLPNHGSSNIPSQTYSNNSSMLPDINNRDSMSGKSGGQVNMIYGAQGAAGRDSAAAN